jgi:hypothetical protein
MSDLEHGRRSSDDVHEREALLSADSKEDTEHNRATSSTANVRLTYIHLIAAFGAGIIACLLSELALCGTTCLSLNDVVDGQLAKVAAEPIAGSTEVHNFPPTSPTNAFPSMFPSDVGFPGGTPTGAEPGVIATAPSYPIQSGAPALVRPSTLGKSGQELSKGFDIFRKWGNLSPWYSVDRTAFGLDSDPGTPETCRVIGLHFLHRHGARYPTAWGSFRFLDYCPSAKLFSASYGGPANFSSRLNQAADKWTTTDNLEFMNDWYVQKQKLSIRWLCSLDSGLIN